MVLFFVLNHEEEKTIIDKMRHYYRIIVHFPHIAVISSHTEKVEMDESTAWDALIRHRIFSPQTDCMLLPYDGIFYDCVDEKSEAMRKMIANMSATINNRENITIINRGPSAHQSLSTLIKVLMRIVRPCAEYAMQIVADEIAKEKQMQRLLQL